MKMNLSPKGMKNKNTLWGFLKKERIVYHFWGSVKEAITSVEDIEYKFNNLPITSLFSGFFIFGQTKYPYNLKGEKKLKYWHHFWEKYNEYIENLD